MAKLRVSSTLNLHSAPKENMAAYVRAGLELLKTAGFDAADFSMGLLPYMGENWEEGMLCAKADGEEMGIRFEVCHLPFSTKIGKDPDFDAQFAADMHRAIEAAKLLGVDCAVMHPNTTTVRRSSFDRQAAYDSVMAHLSPFADHAARIGVHLAVENMRLVPGDIPVHRYCGHPEELCEIADALGIGVCWDFGHAHICGLRQSEALAYVGKRLKVLHVNDNVGWGDDHVPPFCGTIDWKDAMRGLRDAGYAGLFNYEIANRHPAALRPAFAAYLRAEAETLTGMMED